MDNEKHSEKEIILQQIERDLKIVEDSSKNLEKLEINVDQAIDSIIKLKNYGFKNYGDTKRIHKVPSSESSDKDYTEKLNEIIKKLDELSKFKEDINKLKDKINSILIANKDNSKEKEPVDYKKYFDKIMSFEPLLKEIRENDLENKLKGHIDKQIDKQKDELKKSFREGIEEVNKSLNQLTMSQKKDKEIEELKKENKLVNENYQKLSDYVGGLKKILKEDVILLLKDIEHSEITKGTWPTKIDFKFTNDFPEFNKRIDDLINNINNIGEGSLPAQTINTGSPIGDPETKKGDFPKNNDRKSHQQSQKNLAGKNKQRR